jgi:hypothetical protein
LAERSVGAMLRLGFRRLSVRLAPSAAGSCGAGDTQKNFAGAVAICVGIDFGAVSSVTKLPDHAARSIV